MCRRKVVVKLIMIVSIPILLLEAIIRLNVYDQYNNYLEVFKSI